MHPGGGWSMNATAEFVGYYDPEMERTIAYFSCPIGQTLLTGSTTSGMENGNLTLGWGPTNYNKFYMYICHHFYSVQICILTGSLSKMLSHDVIIATASASTHSLHFKQCTIHCGWCGLHKAKVVYSWAWQSNPWNSYIIRSNSANIQYANKINMEEDLIDKNIAYGPIIICSL